MTKWVISSKMSDGTELAPPLVSLCNQEIGTSEVHTLQSALMLLFNWRKGFGLPDAPGHNLMVHPDNLPPPHRSTLEARHRR